MSYPPPEVVKKWLKGKGELPVTEDRYIAERAADWELEGCCGYLARCAAWEPEDIQEMRDFRRPKPPSIKEAALSALKHVEEGWRPVPADCDVIRRALEMLPDA